MPKKVASEIIKIQRRFLCCGEKEGRFTALVRWEIVQNPKLVGGLGIDDLMLKNVALSIKWWWKLMTEEGALWRKVISSIHKEDNTIVPKDTLTRIPGPWRDIRSLSQAHLTPIFFQNIKIQVGGGSRTRLWEDPWVRYDQDTTLKNRFPRLYRISNKKNELIESMGWFKGDIWRWTLTWNKQLDR